MAVFIYFLAEPRTPRARTLLTTGGDTRNNRPFGVESRRRRGGVQSRRRPLRTSSFSCPSSPSGSSLRFLLPAHRTGLADFRHRALGRVSHRGVRRLPCPDEPRSISLRGHPIRNCT
jgi:hypothetical protein